MEDGRLKIDRLKIEEGKLKMEDGRWKIDGVN